MKIKNQFFLNFTLFYSILPCIFIISSFFGLFFDAIKCISFGFLFIYLCVVLRTIVKHGTLSLYTMYLYTSFFFIYSKLFFNLIGHSFLRESWWLEHYMYSESSVIKLVIIAFVSTYILDIVINLKRKEIVNKRFFPGNKKLLNIGFVFLFLSFPGSLYKSILALQVIKEFGYVSIYSGVFQNINYPLWTKGSVTFLYIGFLLILASKPSMKQFFVSMFVFSTYLFSAALKGGRTEFITSVLALLYFYSHFRKIKTKYIVMSFIGLVLFAFFIGTYREGKSENKNTEISKIEKILNFFEGQGTSIYSALATIEWKEDQLEYRKFPYIFSPLVRPVYDVLKPELISTPSIEHVSYRNEMESIISYLSSNEMYLRGFGLGATFIGEMYDFYGFIGVVIWSTLLGLLICYIEENLFRNWLHTCISWFVVVSIIYLPRGMFFSFFYMGYKMITLIIFIILFSKYCLRYKYDK